MSQPDYSAAITHALGRLQRELAPELIYHSLVHTRDDVMPAAMRLAEMSGINGREERLLEVAAAYHDIGFVDGRQKHERLSAEIARHALPLFGFDSHDVETIVGMIMATRLPQSPRTLLEQLLADADLDVLGRPDMVAKNRLLRQELALCGQPMSDRGWYSSQLAFLEKHHYFTDAARQLRGEGKQQNVALLRRCLEIAQSRSSLR